MESNPESEEIILKRLNTEYSVVLSSLSRLSEVIENFLDSRENIEFKLLDMRAFPDDLDELDHENQAEMIKVVQEKKEIFMEMTALAHNLGIPRNLIRGPDRIN